MTGSLASDRKGIEDEHAALITRVQTIKNLLDNAAGFAAVLDAISALLDEALIHFIREEQVMVAARYKGFEDHRQSHDALVKTVRRFLEGMPDGGERAEIERISAFLNDWLRQHMDLEDAAFLRYLESKAA